MPGTHQLHILWKGSFGLSSPAELSFRGKHACSLRKKSRTGARLFIDLREVANSSSRVQLPSWRHLNSCKAKLVSSHINIVLDAIEREPIEPMTHS
jgi:hypothetical protein